MALQKLLALALITLGFFFLLVYFGGGKKMNSKGAASTPMQKIESPKNAGAQENGAPTAIAPPPSPISAPAPVSEEKPGQFNQLEQWLTENASTMSSFSPADRREVDEFVATLQAPEARRLGKIAADAGQDGNKRVLSLYLLGRTTVGTQALTDFLNSEIPLKNNADAHSVDEAFNQKEKALRAMAVEQIVENSPSPQEAKARLIQILQSVRDPWLRDFISQRINELP